MFRVLKLFSILCLALLAGCDRAPAKSGPVAPVVETRKADSGKAVEQPVDPAQLEMVDFASLTLNPPALRSTVLRWEQVLAKASKAGDVHVPWHNYEPRGSYPVVLEWWTDDPKQVSSYGAPGRNALVTKADFRLFSIRYTFRDKKEGKPDWAHVTAERHCVDKWSVQFRNTSSWPGDYSLLSLSFYRRPSATRKYVVLDVIPQLFGWEHRMTFDKATYQFRIALPELPSASDQVGSTAFHSRIRSLSTSPEAFRETCHSIVNDLEQLLLKELPTESAIAQVTEKQQIPGTGTHGGDPPQYSPEPSKRPLKAEEWQTVQEAAHAEIAKRRQIIDEHAAEMHAALVDLLPVHELLQP